MVQWNRSFEINGRTVGGDNPTYFVADIASSHDGDPGRAKDLIWLAKEAGADAAKFQHFKAESIVSDVGFRNLGGQLSHQADWKRSVFETYKAYECQRDWDTLLIETCREAGIDFMTTPYNFEATDFFAPHVAAFKVGSGDVTWTQAIAHIASKGKAVLLATGAADMADVERAVDAAVAQNPDLCLMQCNTNYTGSLENFRYINLNVLKTYANKWPGMVLGLSDHTPGHTTVIGAVTLGARVIEKHFTDDTTREGPDHGFSMDPTSWRAMVDATRELELALGDGVKRIEGNEQDPAVVQRRCLRTTGDLSAGHVITRDDIEALRPAPSGSIEPWQEADILGRKLTRTIAKGEALMRGDFTDA